MSVIGDVFGAFQEVVLIKANVDRLQGNVAKMADDIAGLADGLALLRDRVSRIEGYLDGVTTAARPAQPRIGG